MSAGQQTDSPASPARLSAGDDDTEYRTDAFRMNSMKVGAHEPGWPPRHRRPPLLAPGRAGDAWPLQGSPSSLGCAGGGGGAGTSSAGGRLRQLSRVILLTVRPSRLPAGLALLQALRARLDRVPLCSPPREGAAARPTPAQLHGHCMPQHEEGAACAWGGTPKRGAAAAAARAAPQQPRCRGMLSTADAADRRTVTLWGCWEPA